MPAVHQRLIERHGKRQLDERGALVLIDKWPKHALIRRRKHPEHFPAGGEVLDHRDQAEGKAEPQQRSQEAVART